MTTIPVTAAPLERIARSLAEMRGVTLEAVDPSSISANDPNEVTGNIKGFLRALEEEPKITDISSVVGLAGPDGIAPFEASEAPPIYFCYLGLLHPPQLPTFYGEALTILDPQRMIHIRRSKAPEISHVLIDDRSVKTFQRILRSEDPLLHVIADAQNQPAYFAFNGVGNLDPLNNALTALLRPYRDQKTK